MCRNFYCGWAQELLPEWMQPNLCKVMVSVENWSKGQYLKCIEMGQQMNDEALLAIMDFCKKNNAPYVLQYDGEWRLAGPDEFVQEMLSKSKYTGYKNQ